MKRCATFLVSLALALSFAQPAAGGVAFGVTRRALLSAIKARLMTSEGGIWSYVVNGNQEDRAVAGAGHDQTSESLGLMMAYAATARDWTLFSRVRSFWLNHMRASNGLTYWKLDYRDRPARNTDGSYSSAPIDELRIAKVFATAGVAGGSSYAASEGRALLGAVSNGVVTDDVSWGPWAPSPGTVVAVQYLDVAAMRHLSRLVNEWGRIGTSSLNVMKKAVPSGYPPRTRYNFTSFSCEGGVCETTPGLWIALHLYDQSLTDAAHRIYSFYAHSIKRYGKLVGAFKPTGQAATGYEDLASYALLARLASRLGDRAYALDIVNRFIIPERIRSGPNAGLFSYVTTDAPSFDNLEILLTLEELGVRRVLAD